MADGYRILAAIITAICLGGASFAATAQGSNLKFMTPSEASPLERGLLILTRHEEGGFWDDGHYEDDEILFDGEQHRRGGGGNDWVDLGEQEAANRFEADTFGVGGDRRFRKIRFCIRLNPVNFKDLRIVFANGREQAEPINAQFRKQECLELDIRGDRGRRIDRVVVRYEGVPSPGPQPRVSLQAK